MVCVNHVAQCDTAIPWILRDGVMVRDLVGRVRKIPCKRVGITRTLLGVKEEEINPGPSPPVHGRGGNPVLVEIRLRIGSWHR